METPEPPKEAGTTITFHYHRWADDYEPWDLWLWSSGKTGESYAFTERDEYGAKAVITLPMKIDQVGFLVRKGGDSWSGKDVSKDRFITIQNDTAEVWLLEGEETIAAKPPNLKPRIQSAYLESKRQIVARLTHQVALTGSGPEGFALSPGLPIASVWGASGSDTGTKEVVITLAQDADVTAAYKLQHERFAEAPVQRRGVLDDPAFIYTGEDLGARWTQAATTFRLWAPAASGVELLLYDGPEGGAPAQTVSLAPTEGGTWFAKINGDLEAKYYTYRLRTADGTHEVVDPYAVGAGVNGDRGLIVNLAGTNPVGWELTGRPPLANPTDAILYEMHVRDLSTSPTSGIQRTGKFLGLIETGTKGPNGVATGLDHLKELGITHIHLLPAFDFATVDERRSDQFNWGYDPQNFNVPEGSYATDPNGTVRIREFKQMVQGLHQSGIRVVMDVVYNHTAMGASPFEVIAPTYYYRHDGTGKLANGSGTGNETASEQPMMRKYIVDSVKLWASEYMVDGFRFDLMALHDIETMIQVRAALDAIDPSIIVYGEPWTGGSTPLPESERPVKGNQKNLGIALFNDNIRNAIKGDNDGIVKGFATGAGGQDTAVMRGVVGGIDFDSKIGDFTAHPSESINYVSSHDNLTLWDKIAKSNANDSEADRIKMDLLCQAIIFTSQGIPFMQGGEELLRTKGGNQNSYNAPDSVNQLDWSRKSQYGQAFAYYKGLIAVRKAHPSFRLVTAAQVKEALQFIPAPVGAVAFGLDGSVAGDSWKQIVVIYNPGRSPILVDLPGGGSWQVAAVEQKIGNGPVAGPVPGKATVPGISMMLLYQP